MGFQTDLFKINGLAAKCRRRTTDLLTKVAAEVAHISKAAVVADCADWQICCQEHTFRSGNPAHHAIFSDAVTGNLLKSMRQVGNAEVVFLS